MTKLGAILKDYWVIAVVVALVDYLILATESG